MNIKKFLKGFGLYLSVLTGLSLFIGAVMLAAWYSAWLLFVIVLVSLAAFAAFDDM